MNNFPHSEITSKDVERGLLRVDICDNVMECPSCLYFLDRRNHIRIEEILEKEKLPKNITSIKLKINPTDISLGLFCFNGIETIVFNLFRNENTHLNNDLKNGKSFLKVYFQKENLYNLPVIIIEIIFFKKLSEKSIDILWKKMKNDLIHFIGRIGDIDVVKINNSEQLKGLLEIPLLIGYPEFRKNNGWEKFGLSDEQIIELNYFHGLSHIKLDMDYIINNSSLSLFDDILEMIFLSKMETLSKKEVNEFVETLFKNDGADSLPF